MCMIKVFVDKCTINQPKEEDVLENCLNSHLEIDWKNCTPKELLEKSLKDFDLNLEVAKGAGNTQVPGFIVNLSRTVVLYVSNEYSVCGEKQILYFFLENVVTGKIQKDLQQFLFTFNNDGIVEPCVQVSADKREMTENPGLNKNSETLLRIINSR